MPDPIHDLETMPTRDLAVNPLPPSEVRRLGERRRARRRHTSIAAAVAVIAIGVTVPFALTAGDDHGNGDQRHELKTPSPKPTPRPSVIVYPGNGITVRTPADTEKLTGTTDAFRAFIAGQLQNISGPARCAEIDVQKYSARGFAIGGVGRCGGYRALWALSPETGLWSEGLGTQDTWDCDGLRYLAVPRSFAGNDCFDYSGSFGPTEVDGLRLGMTKAQIEAAGGTILGDGVSGCAAVRLPYSTQPAGRGDGFWSARSGLVELIARPGVKTDKKVGLGSSEAKVKAAYPNGSINGNLHWVVPLPGGNSYQIGFGGGIVQQLLLVSAHDNCYG